MTYRNRPPTFPLHPSFRALDNEAVGMALDGQTLEACVSDRLTPANNFLGPMASKFAYASPSTKWVWNRHGQLASGTTLRCDHDPGTLDSSTVALNSLPGLKVIPITGPTIYAVGQTLVVSDAGNIMRWMAGEVVNWNAGTKSVTLDVYAASGLFSGADWKVIVARGVRVEPQSANLWTNSNTIGGTGWTLTNALANPTAAISPDASQTMSEIAGNSVFNGRANSPTVNITPGATIAVSVFISRGTATSNRFGLFNGGFGVSHGSAMVNWSGDVPAFGTVSASVISSALRLVGRHGGKSTYRLSLVINTDPGQSTARMAIYPDTNAPYSGSVFAWGAQFENGSEVSSLIPTTSAQVTRAADAIGILTSAFPYNDGDGLLQVNGANVSPTIVSGQLRLPYGHINDMRWVPSP